MNNFLEALESLHLTGVRVNYFFVCPRKLWLFDRGLSMEQHSERVLLGKILGEESYPRERRRHITIDDLISIDILDNLVQEVKHSKAMGKASTMQVGYYLYYLRGLGIEREGVLLYPRLRKRKGVVLTEVMVQEIEEAVREIGKILKASSLPKAERKLYCVRCVYSEFCFG